MAILQGLRDPRRKSQFQHHPPFPLFTYLPLELHPIIWRLSCSLRVCPGWFYSNKRQGVTWTLSLL